MPWVDAWLDMDTNSTLTATYSAVAAPLPENCPTLTVHLMATTCQAQLLHLPSFTDTDALPDAELECEVRKWRRLGCLALRTTIGPMPFDHGFVPSA